MYGRAGVPVVPAAATVGVAVDAGVEPAPPPPRLPGFHPAPAQPAQQHTSTLLDGEKCTVKLF